MAQTLARSLDSPFGAALEPYGADLPPAFGLFVARAAERAGGWREFLRGS